MKTVNEKEARRSILDEAEKMNNSDFEDAWNNKEKTIRKSSRIPLFKRFLIDIKDLFLMVKDFVSGKYRNIPFWMIIAIIGTLFYVVNPLDLAPDVIPIVGLIDDILVIYLCIFMVRKDLKKYRIWKSSKL